MAFIMLCVVSVRRFLVTIQAVWDGLLMLNSICLESIMLFPWIIYNFFFISVFLAALPSNVSQKDLNTLNIKHFLNWEDSPQDPISRGSRMNPTISTYGDIAPSSITIKNSCKFRHAWKWKLYQRNAEDIYGLMIAITTRHIHRGMDTARASPHR